MQFQPGLTKIAVNPSLGLLQSRSLDNICELHTGSSQAAVRRGVFASYQRHLLMHVYVVLI